MIKSRDCCERKRAIYHLFRSSFLGFIAIPLKSKRQRQSQNTLAIGREKLARVISEQSASSQQDAPSVSTMDSVDAELSMADLLSAPDDDDETVDPTFGLDVTAQSDTAHQLESFCENWVLQLD